LAQVRCSSACFVSDSVRAKSPQGMSADGSVLTNKRLSHEQAQNPTFDPPQTKRRRISLDEVENELRAAGLSQPALSFIHELGQCTESDEKHGTILLKRTQAEPEQQDTTKRRRVCLGSVPVLLPKAHVTRAESLAIVPYHRYPPCRSEGMGSQRRLQLRLASELTRLAVDPAGVIFEVFQPGLLMAELPSYWQPLISYNGNIARITKVALDSKGTAYFLSAAGEVLMSLSAVKYLEGEYREDDLKLVYLDEKELEARIGEDFSPSTSVPSPSMEDATDDDTAVETMELEDV